MHLPLQSHLKAFGGSIHLSDSLQFSKNYEIPTNDTDKNMKFTTKSVYIVASVAHLKYLYIKYLYAKFTCLRYAHVLFSVKLTVLQDSASHECR